MCRHRHDRTGSVVEQHVVGDPDGNLLAGRGVDRDTAGIPTLLLEPLLLTLDARRIAHRLDPGLDLLATRVIGNETLYEGMLRSQHHEGGSVHRIGTGGEDGERLLQSRNLEVEIGSGRAPDPVTLHDLDPLGPAREGVQSLQESLGVVGDAIKPLLEIALTHLGATALTVAIDHLLVGQHGLATRAPVDWGLLLIGDPLLQHLEEEPLVPPIVVGFA